MDEIKPIMVIDLDNLEKAANRLKVIAVPIRVAIIELLLEKKKLSVTEIYKTLKIEQPSISVHLRILKEYGVLSSRRDGQRIIYAVKTQSLKNLLSAVNKCNAA